MVISLKPTILTTTSASSRSLSTPRETTVLNVASSLQQTQHILSIDRLDIHSPPPGPSSNPQSIMFLHNSSSPLSLRLHSRDNLVASQHLESSEPSLLSSHHNIK
ncbi:Protein ASPARTIC PROTEASE IN GUARD CELL 1 [Raphanus sativus]|nr:Protein ASPARTIC PROTEASE IN GUARD CELL 1 [Raphanus sativus]